MTFQSHILPEHDVRPYSIAQLADRWGCSDSMVRKLINQGQLQTFRIGALIRVSAAEVERYEKCPVNPSPIPSSDSEADLQSCGETLRAAPVAVVNSPRQIGRAPKRKLASSGKKPTVRPGLRVVS